MSGVVVGFLGLTSTILPYLVILQIKESPITSKLPIISLEVIRILNRGVGFLAYKGACCKAK